MRRVILLLAFLSVAVGCGAQQENQLVNPKRPTANAETSRMEMTVRFGKNSGIKGEGLFDYANDRSHMTLKPLSPQYKDSFPAENLFIGRTSYSGWKLLGRKVWLKDPGYEPRTETFIPGPGGPRPDRLLAILIKAGRETEILGSDMIRGVTAKHYRVHVTPSKLGDRSDPTWDAVVEAWVDEDGLVRRLELPSGRGAPVQIYEFFDFGVAVDIQAPADDDVLSQSEFDKLMHADCKQHKERGMGVDESECTRSRVVEAGPVETLPIPTVEELP